MKKISCDIFCRVIDNFGDIGVCWRLTRQLRHEYHLDVRLWLDDINALVKIWPEAQALADQTAEKNSFLEEIEICAWHSDENNFFKHTQALSADIVIEAFACHIPDIYLQKMKQKEIAPFWFNLEYLSAEKWIEDCHGLSSMHPATGMKKIYFFPGFTEKSGGLIREKNLITEREIFLNDPSSRIEKLKNLGIDCSDQISNEAFWVSLFSYENVAISSLIKCWACAAQPTVCLIPNGKSLSSLDELVGRRLKTGDEWQLGQLTIKVIPFIRQDKFDQLLWLCDCNFVRGEDSFVRAQWAGKPFVWQIYPQDDQIHLEKLNAFLVLFAKENSSFSSALANFWLNWNQEAECAESWSQLMIFWPNWQAETKKWAHQHQQSPDLAQKLLAFTN